MRFHRCVKGDAGWSRYALGVEDMDVIRLSPGYVQETFDNSSGNVGDTFKICSD